MMKITTRRVESDGSTAHSGYSHLINKSDQSINVSSPCLDLNVSSNLSPTKKCGVEKSL